MRATLSANAKLKVWVALALVAFIAALAVLLVAFAQQEQSRRDICVAVNNLNLAITQSLQRGEKNLPRLAYYRQHPREMADQLREIERELVVFRPRTCR